MMQVAACLTAFAALRSPQVLRMRDATTNQEISLVGTVHYNPASVARSKEEVTLALEKNQQQLGAVVVESCQSRWTKSLELAPPGSATSQFIKSEMQGAVGVALQSGVPVMLGDADAGPFLERVRSLAKQTIREFGSPLSGWGSIYRDFARTLPGTLNPEDVAKSDLLLEGEAPIGPADFARPDVLLGFVASLVRYPAAFALKAPVPFAIFASFLFALDSTAGELDELAAVSLQQGDVLSLPIAASFIFTSLTTGLSVMTARLLLVAFLEERNAEVCPPVTVPNLWALAPAACLPLSPRVRVSPPQLARSIRRAARESGGPVVAILGGLHVNGVARLLMSEATPDADSPRDNDGVWWEAPPEVDATKWAE